MKNSTPSDDALVMQSHFISGMMTVIIGMLLAPVLIGLLVVGPGLAKIKASGRVGAHRFMWWLVLVWFILVVLIMAAKILIPHR